MNKIKRAFEKLMLKIAEQNKTSFGDQRMDCCDLNRSSSSTHKKK